jgi:single-strand DNA-binding protein
VARPWFGHAAWRRRVKGMTRNKQASGTAEGPPEERGTQARRTAIAAGVPPDLDRVVLAGTVHGSAERRELASGSVVVAFDVAVDLESGRSVVPVTWTDPPPRPSIEAGAALVVIGHVRRRFFRTGGATQSRTEVVAEAVLPAGSRAKISQAVERVAAELVAALARAPGG